MSNPIFPTIKHCAPRHSWPALLLPSQTRPVKTALSPWNFSSKYGVQLKTAPTTEHSSYGLVPTPLVNVNREGTRPFQPSPCSRSTLETNNGRADPIPPSVRAWRELRFNKKYAEKLEKKLARRKEKEVQHAKAAAEAAAKKSQAKANPFAVRVFPSTS